MDALLSLIPGGGLTAIIAGVVALLAMLGFGAKKIQDSGVNKEKAREAEKRAQNIEKLKRAADARPAGSVLDDKNNRDER